MCQIAPTWTLTIDNKREAKKLCRVCADHNQHFHVETTNTMASLNRIMFSAMPRNEKQKMKIQVHCTLMTFPAIRFLCSTFFIFVRFKPNKNDFFSRRVDIFGCKLLCGCWNLQVFLWNDWEFTRFWIIFKKLSGILRKPNFLSQNFFGKLS